MSRKLQIEVFDCEANLIEKLYAKRIDSTNVMTTIYLSETNKKSEVVRYPVNIVRWNIIPGMITIYYVNGYYIEITRPC